METNPGQLPDDIPLSGLPDHSDVERNLGRIVEKEGAAPDFDEKKVGADKYEPRPSDHKSGFLSGPTLNFRWLERHIWVSNAPTDPRLMVFGMKYGHRLSTERVLQQAFTGPDGPIWRDVPVVVENAGMIPASPDDLELQQFHEKLRKEVERHRADPAIHITPEIIDGTQQATPTSAGADPAEVRPQDLGQARPEGDAQRPAPGGEAAPGPGGEPERR